MLTPTPEWLEWLAVASVVLAAAGTVAMALDIALGRRQAMAVMDVVWPVTSLYWGPAAVWAYLDMGRAERRTEGGPTMGTDRPFWKSVFIGTCHCGAGCAIGDIVGEVLVGSLGLTILGSQHLAGIVVPFGFAYLLGIGFQYATIAPMRGISGWPAIREALKADTVSITAYEIGMLGWMFISRDELIGAGLSPTDPVYLFTMQIAMVIGFVCSYPANWWLIRRGIKSAM